MDIIFKIQENLLIMISNTIEMLFIVCSNIFLQKNVYFFILKEILHWFMVLFSCLINAIFSIILMEIFFVFSNALSIFELMLCNRNLTKFDILTLLSSDCRAWALKLSEPLKNSKKKILSSFCRFQL